MEGIKNVAESLPEPSPEIVNMSLTYIRMLLGMNYLIYIFVSIGIALAVIILLPKENCIFRKIIALLPALLIVLYRTMAFFSDFSISLEIVDGGADPAIKSTNSILISVMALIMLVFAYNMANYHRLSFFTIFSGSILLLIERVLSSSVDSMNIFVYQATASFLDSYLHSVIMLVVISLLFSYLSSTNRENDVEQETNVYDSSQDPYQYPYQPRLDSYQYHLNQDHYQYQQPSK